MSKKEQVPTLRLTGPDYIHAVPDDENLEVIIHWKGKNFQPEFINPVKAFAKQDGKFKVINRSLPDTSYVFELKEIKKIYLIPTGE